MFKYRCVCGGNLFLAHDNEFICDACERIWYRCSLCSGELHSRDENGILEELSPGKTSESRDCFKDGRK